MRRVMLCLFSAILWFGNTPTLRAQETPAAAEAPQAAADAPAMEPKSPSPHVRSTCHSSSSRGSSTPREPVCGPSG